MRLLVVGAGDVTRELLKRIGEAWDVTIVEADASRVEALRGVRVFEAFEGDGSSSVALERAGLEDADALLAATEDDDVNLEACRIARARKVRRVLAVAADPARAPEFRDLSVPVLSAAALAGRELEHLLQARAVSSKTFAEGKVEAMEFTVAASSPVRGMPIGELNGPAMRVVALLRDGTLASLEDGIELAPGDLVTVIGPAADLPSLVQTFTSGTPRFPVDFGKRVAVALEGSEEEQPVLREAVLVTRNSRATSLDVLHPGVTERLQEDEDGGEDVPKAIRRLVDAESEGVEVGYRRSRRPDEDLLRLPETESVGVIVLSPPSGLLAGLRIRRLLRTCRETGTPILFARGRRSHDRIVAAARRSRPGRAAARAAIGLAELGKGHLTALAVEDPEFIGGPAAAEEAQRAVEWVVAEASIHGLEADALIRTGNPVHAFLEVSHTADLVVLGLQEARIPVLGSTLVTRIVRDAVPSVLVVPARE